MNANDLDELIRKRHAGPAWIVLRQVANATGGNTKRHADAVAISVWPSHGYSIHGFETKVTRGDVQRELANPQKADAVARYCDYWWLTISDETIIDGLVLPESWGVLAPKRNVLRVVRKAPKLKAKDVDRAFFASITRNVTCDWVPKHVHDELKESTHAKVRAQLEKERRYGQEDAVRDRDELLKRIADFEAASGVEIGRYQSGNIGEAVRLALDARSATGNHAIERSISTLQNTSDLYDRLATQARAAVAALRAIAKADPPLPPLGLGLPVSSASRQAAESAVRGDPETELSNTQAETSSTCDGIAPVTPPARVLL